MLRVPNAAERLILRHFLNIGLPEDLDLKLYTNDRTPADTDTEAEYTEMGATQGYALVQVDASLWAITPGTPSVALYPQQVWTFAAGGPTSLYGYFVVQRMSGKLMWAERFASPPFVVRNAGDNLKVTPRVTLNTIG